MAPDDPIDMYGPHPDDGDRSYDWCLDDPSPDPQWLAEYVRTGQLWSYPITAPVAAPSPRPALS